jgi:hypothetical protein
MPVALAGGRIEDVTLREQVASHHFIGIEGQS